LSSALPVSSLATVKSIRSLSLELKLPLLMSIVLATVLTIALFATYSTLRTTALDAARERLLRATRQIAVVGTTGLATQGARYLTAARDSAIRRALAQQSPARVADARKLLATLSLPADSGMPVELWTSTGRKIAFVGNDVGVSMREDLRPDLPERISLAIDPDASRAMDSLRLGPLYQDGGRMHFWFVMPVVEQGRVLGFITHQRRIATGPATQQTLRELSGDSVSFYYRNVDGTSWSNRSSVSAPPHTDADTVTGTAMLNDERILFHEERIGRTPLVVGMSIPERTIVARTRRSIEKLAGLAAALLIGGVVAAWLIGRSVARPLGRITDAVSSLATGDYRARVPETGEEEVRRLAHSFNNMAEEIGASRSALVKQTDEARAASNAKSEFLTTMSHELRTPLNAIGGYADLLEMGLRGPVTEEQKRDLARIKTSQEHLLGLISSVLDLSRIEAGRLRYELTDVALDPFLAGMDALIAPQAAAKDIRLERQPAPADHAVIADREKLRQILLNLLSNAIRHASTGGSVVISTDARGSKMAVIVEDTGPGIPADKREVIFEPFVQLDRSLTQTREGLGLGLAISRDLARGMSGELTAEGRLGGGGRFVLVLPRGNASQNSAGLFSGEVPAAKV
jgi:signal transduction histidine kinase